VDVVRHVGIRRPPSVASETRSWATMPSSTPSRWHPAAIRRGGVFPSQTLRNIVTGGRFLLRELSGGLLSHDDGLAQGGSSNQDQERHGQRKPLIPEDFPNIHSWKRLSLPAGPRPRWASGVSFPGRRPTPERSWQTWREKRCRAGASTRWPLSCSTQAIAAGPMLS